MAISVELNMMGMRGLATLALLAQIVPPWWALCKYRGAQGMARNWYLCFLLGTLVVWMAFGYFDYQSQYEFDID